MTSELDRVNAALEAAKQKREDAKTAIEATRNKLIEHQMTQADRDAPDEAVRGIGDLIKKRQYEIQLLGYDLEDAELAIKEAEKNLSRVYREHAAIDGQIWSFEHGFEFLLLKQRLTERGCDISFEQSKFDSRLLKLKRKHFEVAGVRWEDENHVAGTPSQPIEVVPEDSVIPAGRGRPRIGSAAHKTALSW